MLIRRRTVLALSLPLVGAGVGVACEPKEVLDRRRELLRAWGSELLIPSYRELATRSGTLGAAIGAFRQSPSDEGLNDARDAWWEARRPLKRRELFAFGPFTEEPLRIGPAIDFWPARPEAVDEALAETDGGQVLVEQLGAAAKGLPALEYLLFGPEASVSQFAAEPSRGSYAEALANDLVVQAKALADAWDPSQGGFLNELTEAGRGSSLYKTLPLALGEIVNRMAFLCENVRLDKLGRPLGETSGGVAQPDKAESQFSGRSAEDIYDNFFGLEQMYYGDPETGLVGLEDYLAFRGRSFRLRMRKALDPLYEAIERMGPVTSAVTSDPKTVTDVMDRLTDLQRLIQVDILNALSLVVGFNDTDGD